MISVVVADASFHTQYQCVLVHLDNRHLMLRHFNYPGDGVACFLIVFFQIPENSVPCLNILHYRIRPFKLETVFIVHLIQSF